MCRSEGHAPLRFVLPRPDRGGVPAAGAAGAVGTDV